MKIDVLIIGAGFTGSVIAQRLADNGKQIVIIDQRDHIGGNAYDEYDSSKVLVHKYGPHIFHTNSKKIFDYLSQFTKWRTYEHKVLAKVGSKLVPIPINRNTLNELYNLNLNTEEEVQAFYNNVKQARNPILTSEDVVLNAVGNDLYEKFFKGYTLKQWGLSPSQLNASVAARIPTRTNTDNRYFSDEFQTMPADGYTQLFKKLLDHPNIKIELSADFFKIRNKYDAKHIVYTGPIDVYFDYKYGKLPYRSLTFEHEHLPDIDQYQSTGTINYPNDFEYTRITEFKHLTGQSIKGTSIVKEFPQSEGDPYYPVPKPENDELFKKYSLLAQQEKHVTFVGRLAQYKYYNMDQVVGAALITSEKTLSYL